jgi:hypothetical protein
MEITKRTQFPSFLPENKVFSKNEPNSNPKLTEGKSRCRRFRFIGAHRDKTIFNANACFSMQIPLTEPGKTDKLFVILITKQDKQA